MAKFRVVYDRENCIGAGTCVGANGEYWSIELDDKATLKDSVYDPETKMWILETDEKGVQKQIDAAKVCPVQVIHVYDENGNKLS